MILTSPRWFQLKWYGSLDNIASHDTYRYHIRLKIIIQMTKKKSLYIGLDRK